jgi:hypothetical protein
MVRQEHPTPGVLLLAPVPLSIEEHEGGFSDLPPNTVRVIVPAARPTGNGKTPAAAPPRIGHTTRRLLLTGTLQVGTREENDGSVSLVRLILDPASHPGAKNAGARSPRPSRRPEPGKPAASRSR